MATPEMVEIWRTGSFAKDPPNATASVFSKDGSSVADVVVVLKAAKLEGEKLTFDVQVLEGSLGKADGPASVFIDTLWWGVGSNGFSYYGTSQTTGGETPAIGDPHGTSTFSGWSNPSPTHPYVPPPRELRNRGRRTAAARARSAHSAALQPADLRQAPAAAVLLRPAMNRIRFLAVLAAAALPDGRLAARDRADRQPRARPR